MGRQHSQAILSALEAMDEDKEHLVGLTFDMWKAAEGAVYTLDLFANGAIHRSLALGKGFRSLVSNFNLLCAGAILRMQLDTALRFHAAYLAPQAFDFANAVLRGEEIRKLKDRNNQQMHDANLVKSLMRFHPWVEPIYRQANGYVHLSEIHTVGTYGEVNREESIVGVQVTGEDPELPDSVYLETIGTFRAATQIFKEHLWGWIELKRSPSATKVALEPIPDGDWSKCPAYLDIGRNAP
jgi:hypothetical protein